MIINSYTKKNRAGERKTTRKSSIVRFKYTGFPGFPCTSTIAI